MTSKPRGGASRPCGHPGQSRLLQLLRRHGFADELPPSTVSWLDTRPAFRWLADNLSDANFIDPETQSLYDAIQVHAGGGGATGGSGSGAGAGAGGGAGQAAGGREQLMSAIGITSVSSSCSSDDGGGDADGATGEGNAGRATEAQGDSCEELQRAVEEQRSHLELLQRHLSSMASASRRLSSAVAPRGAAQRRRATLASLRAERLRAAQAVAATAGDEADGQLHGLAEALEKLARLAEGAGTGGDEWLLCALDASGYAARDAEVQELVNRGLGLVSAAAGVMPGGRSLVGDNGSGDDSESDCGGNDAGSKDAVGPSRGDVRRWRDQERRNEGLREELARQRAAFKAAYDQRMAALAEQAGLEGAVSALEALAEAERLRHAGRGGPAAAGEGAEAMLQQVPQLRRETEALERELAALTEGSLPALHAELARLNDTHGDYEAQLAKMRVAHGRKKALIDALLEAAARHAVLRHVQAGELGLVASLEAATDAARSAIEATAAAAACRDAACTAATAAVAAAQQRSSVAPEDVYVTRLQRLMRPGAADWEAGFSSLRELASSLSCLANSLRDGGDSLQAGLFAELPGRLAEIVEAERHLRGLAFPPAGSKDAAPGNSSGGRGTGGIGPQAQDTPVLTSPAMAEAMRGLESLNHSIGVAINRLLQQQQDWAAVQRQQAREQQLERRVMALMFTNPPQLAAAVADLRARVQAAEAGAAAAAAAEGAAPAGRV